MRKRMRVNTGLKTRTPAAGSAGFVTSPGHAAWMKAREQKK
jgi:hypothetical protein